ncbi:MFS transporter [Paracoccaceae bacterium]|nr:MFS transporter [Paracoccaceae bacterium]
MIITDFYIKNLRWLYIVFVLTFCSAFGQTFFISLFSGEIRAAFELTHGQWGLIYSCATLSSAILILFVGGFADRIPARNLSTLTILGLIIFIFLMATNTSVWGLMLIILGLRFFGQGMLGHISMVFCGKWFFKNKGKAVAVANSGYALAEAIMPTIFVALISFLSWQTSWYVAIIMSVLILASVRLLAKTERNKGPNHQKKNHQVGMLKKSWKRSEMLKSWVFWAAVPGLMTSPMITTTLFFHQIHLVEIKSWALSTYVLFIPAYSAATLVALYLVGYLVDKFSTKIILPIFLFPLVSGLLFLSIATSYLELLFIFILFGLSAGAYIVVYGTFFPEFFGSVYLGSVRTVGVTIMVFSSAVGPVLSGYFIDLGYLIDHQFKFFAIFSILASLLFLIINLCVKLPEHAE